MISAQLPFDEAARLTTLRSFNVLDTEAEEVFDQIVRLAARLTGSPIAMVTLVDAGRQWFKASHGLDAAQTPRDRAFCAHAILEPDRPLSVPDATADARFADNPLVTGAPYIRAYLGVPLVARSGQAIGTLCVIDRTPRHHAPDEIEVVSTLARAVMSNLELRRALRSAEEMALTIRNLLDNADQGFLTVTPDLLVGEQISAACEALLGEAPAGKPIMNLLCRNTPDAVTSAMRATLDSVFRDRSDFSRELKLALLPTAFELDGRSLTIAYKFLTDSGQLMLILTDVTETVLLTETVETERQRLEMIVMALTEAEPFGKLVSDYQQFAAEALPPLIERVASPAALSEIYRQVHTYKGLLAQFSFRRSPRYLHAVETALKARSDWTTEAARDAIAPAVLLAELKRDLKDVSNVVDDDLALSGRRTVLLQHQVRSLELAAQSALASSEGRAASPQLRQLLQTLVGLGMLEVKAVLKLHGRRALVLATQLGKLLAPIQISGDDTRLRPELHDAFLRSLVHVFSNAIYHGIEAPEERVLKGKPAEGSIHCAIRDRGDWLEILIEDDGNGVDREVLEHRLVGSGQLRSQVESLSLGDLLCCEGLSSRNTVSEVSGRGIGLAAVKAELDRLGGSVAVSTTLGKGTYFRLMLPVRSGERAGDDMAAEGIAA